MTPKQYPRCDECGCSLLLKEEVDNDLCTDCQNETPAKSQFEADVDGIVKLIEEDKYIEIVGNLCISRQIDVSSRS